MSDTQLKYFNPHPTPTVKIKQDGFNFYLSSINLKRKSEVSFWNVIREIMANDGIVEIDTRLQYAKSFKYDNRYINEDDLKTYLADIFKENGFDVTFEHDNK
jgi:hypothetical protein